MDRRVSIFALVKLLTPILLIFPFLTRASKALHVSAIGTSITWIRPEIGLTGNRTEEGVNATGQWILSGLLDSQVTCAK